MRIFKSSLLVVRSIMTVGSIALGMLSNSIAQAQVQAQSQVPPELATKADASVIANAIAGRPQDVLVEYDTSSNDALVKQRHPELQAPMPESMTIEQSRALARTLDQERRKDLSDLKEKVFPNRVRGNSYITENYEDFPMSLVHVQDLKTLLVLLKDSNVKMIWENRSGHVHGTNNLQLIGQPQTAGLGAKGDNTRVAVLDTGLSSSQLSEFSSTGAFPACRPSWAYASYGDLWGTGNCRIQNALNFTTSNVSEIEVGLNIQHGTLVGAIVATVAPLTKLSMLEVADAGGNVAMNNVLRALQWVMDDRLSSPPIVAVNMSLGFTPLYSSACTSALSPIINQLISAGIVPVAASGNDASFLSIEIPACNTGVVAVGAVTDSPIAAANYGNCTDPALSTDGLPCFSNGAGTSILTLLAPGVDIHSSGTNAGTGTSFSAPHVAGAVAALRGTAAYPSESVSTTTSRMTSTGKLVVGTSVPRLQLDSALSGGFVPTPRNPCLAHPTWCN